MGKGKGNGNKIAETIFKKKKMNGSAYLELRFTI